MKFAVGEDGAPEVRFYHELEGLGVCSVAHIWHDNDEGWDKAEAYFATIGEEVAIQSVKSTYRLLSKTAIARANNQSKMWLSPTRNCNRSIF